jgi:uncharacterized membrane protein
MKLRLKEEPGEWRKTALLSALGLAALCCLLRWRRVLPATGCGVGLGLLGLLAVAAMVRPIWFRGYYRLSMRAGFGASRVMGLVVLMVVFWVVVTPLGLAMRLFVKDPLRLRRRKDAKTYWAEVRRKSSLDQLF